MTPIRLWCARLQVISIYASSSLMSVDWALTDSPSLVTILLLRTLAEPLDPSFPACIGEERAGVLLRCKVMLVACTPDLTTTFCGSILSDERLFPVSMPVIKVSKHLSLCHHFEYSKLSRRTK